MKVLLNQDMDRLGRMGEVVEVADGYARNFLIPRELAVAVTRGRVREIEERKRVLGVKAERLRQELESVAEKVRSQKIAVKARCSESGKLFGSVTNRQLAAEIEAVTGEEIDRHKVVIQDRIRTVGTYRAVIKLHHDVEIDLEFEVEGEGFVPDEPVEAGAGSPDAAEGEAEKEEPSAAADEPTGEEEGSGSAGNAEAVSESPPPDQE